MQSGLPLFISEVTFSSACSAYARGVISAACSPEVEMIVVAGIEPVIERISELIALESFADTVSRKLHSVEHSARLAELLPLLSERFESPQSLFVVDIVVIMISQGYCPVAYACRLGEDIFDCHLGFAQRENEVCICRLSRASSSRLKHGA